MKEIINIVFSDRLKSYFYRTFIVTWLIVNWKIILTIFGFGLLEESIQDKGLIFAVQHYSGNYCNLIFIPLLFSCILIWALPKIDLKIAKYKEGEMKTKYLKEVKYSRETLYSGKVINRKDNQIEELKIKLASAEADTNNVTDNYKLLLKSVNEKNEIETKSVNYDKTIEDIFGKEEWTLYINSEKIEDYFLTNNKDFNYKTDQGSKTAYHVIEYKYVGKDISLLIEPINDDLGNLLDINKPIKCNYFILYIEKMDEYNYKGHYRFLEKYPYHTNEAVKIEIKRKYNNPNNIKNE